MLPKDKTAVFVYNILKIILDNLVYLKAISAYQEALQIFTLKKYPEDYARTQSFMANAFLQMSDIRNKEENLNYAINANLEALEVYKPDNNSEQCARVSLNLGVTYGNLAKIGDQGKNLQN